MYHAFYGVSFIDRTKGSYLLRTLGRETLQHHIIITDLNKEILIVILTMKADIRSYLNDKSVWDGWMKTQRIEIWSSLVTSEFSHEPLHVGNGFPTKMVWNMVTSHRIWKAISNNTVLRTDRLMKVTLTTKEAKNLIGASAMKNMIWACDIAISDNILCWIQINESADGNKKSSSRWNNYT